MTETPTTTPEEEKIRQDPDVKPREGETPFTDIGTPSEHASEVVAEREPASSGDPDPAPSHEGVNRVLIFLNEVAGGRKLVTACRELADKGASYFAVVAPQNQPAVGQLVATPEETHEAAQSRVDVTQAVLLEFGIESESAVMDPDPFLAIGDAVRATSPDIVLLSALYESRYGLRRRDLVEWAKDNLGTRVEHIPVRVDDDAVKWGLTHTLVVATQTVNSPDLLARLKERAKSGPHRYTFISPRSGAISREEVCASLAATLAELYREEIDATGAPLSPEPLPAIKNALEHYRVDDILISTLKGEKSKWVEDGLIEKVKSLTDKPVEHLEASPSPKRRSKAGAAA
ncbi:MAG: hypothetical protein QOD60_1079 [Solirubrobacterales bacterium]|nr:hypothetical protein [Solirubrobacterales bacterium]